LSLRPNYGEKLLIRKYVSRAFRISPSAPAPPSPSFIHHCPPPPNQHTKHWKIRLFLIAGARRPSLAIKQIEFAANSREESCFPPKLPCHPVYQSRSAMPPGARPDAASSTRRAAARPSGRIASRRQRSPRW